MSGIISNTTSINYLVLIGHITVLRDLYGRMIIPQAVLGELQQAGYPCSSQSVGGFPSRMAGGPSALDPT